MFKFPHIVSHTALTNDFHPPWPAQVNHLANSGKFALFLYPSNGSAFLSVSACLPSLIISYIDA